MTTISLTSHRIRSIYYLDFDFTLNGHTLIHAKPGGKIRVLPVEHRSGGLSSCSISLAGMAIDGDGLARSAMWGGDVEHVLLA